MKRLQDLTQTIALACLTIILIWATILLCCVMYHSIKHIGEPSDLDKSWQLMKQAQDERERELKEQFKNLNK